MAEKEVRSRRLAFFGDLPEEDLHLLYSVASTKTLAADDYLIRRGSFDQVVYLITKGSLRAWRNGGENDDSITLVEGDCIGNTPASTLVDSFTTCMALEPLSVVVLDQAALEQLPPTVQAYIYGKLNGLASEVIRSFRERERSLVTRTELLGDYIRDNLQRHGRNYGDAPLIQKIVKNIPRLPVHVNDLLSMLQDRDVTARAIVEVAREDPALVSVVLKTVNSAYYSLVNKIADFHHAVILLGFNQIYQLVLSLGIRNIMPHTEGFQELHAHSVLISHTGYELSKMSKKEKPVVMSTVGLLHDIGKSVIFLLRKQNPSLRMFFDMLDHAKLGALLLKQWNIPDSIHFPVENQTLCEFTSPERLPAQHRNALALLYVSHLCYDCLRESRTEKPQGAFVDEYLGVLGLQGMSVKRLTVKAVLPALKKNAEKFPVHVKEFFARILKDFYAEEEAA